MTFPIAHDADWLRAEEIVRDAAIEISKSSAVQRDAAPLPIPISDLEPRVFVRATDNDMELAARFVIPVRTARVATDELTRRVHRGLEAAGIAIAPTTMDVTVISGDDRTSRESSRSE